MSEFDLDFIKYLDIILHYSLNKPLYKGHICSKLKIGKKQDGSSRFL